MTDHAKPLLCWRCQEPALLKCYSDAGRREVNISGLCEPCFDEITAEPEDDGPSDADAPPF